MRCLSASITTRRQSHRWVLLQVWLNDRLLVVLVQAEAILEALLMSQHASDEVIELELSDLQNTSVQSFAELKCQEVWKTERSLGCSVQLPKFQPCMTGHSCVEMGELGQRLQLMGQRSTESCFVFWPALQQFELPWQLL